MFGNIALKSVLSAGFEQGLTVTIELIAKLNVALVSSWLGAEHDVCVKSTAVSWPTILEGRLSPSPPPRYPMQ
jgi:hypothetical protein